MQSLGNATACPAAHEERSEGDVSKAVSITAQGSYSLAKAG
jgi:hypothetical protein